MIQDARDEEATRLYNPAMLPRPTPPPMRAERATIPDFEEEVTDEVLIHDEPAPAFTFVKRTCVLDEAEIELARSSSPSSSLFVPTPRAVVPTVLSERDVPPATRRQSAWAVLAKVAVLLGSACVGGFISYRFDLGPHALVWLRYALAI